MRRSDLTWGDVWVIMMLRSIPGLRRDIVDPVIAKLIISREKSIETLETEVAQLSALVKAAKLPNVAKALEVVLRTKQQRLAKLKLELVGFKQAEAK
ncbi:MAG: hypothetical protein [Microviridae sp.]|nr:MAG: hypothetical protein [Microviridae sp.]